MINVRTAFIVKYMEDKDYVCVQKNLERKKMYACMSKFAESGTANLNH